MLSEYEQMEQFAYENDIRLLSDSLPEDLSGFYFSNTEHGLKTITLNKKLETSAEKTCVLAEEIEHYITTPINLFCAPRLLQNRYERVAKLNATKRLIPLEKLINAWLIPIRNQYELADYLNVTCDFLIQGLELYKECYSDGVKYRGFRIGFDPLFITPGSIA